MFKKNTKTKSKKTSWISNRVIRKKILFTVFIFLVYRIGCTITIPGIKNSYIELGKMSPLLMMNMMSGGSLTRFSIFALGVGPYITSSIIIELLAYVIPALEDWKDQGEKGRSKMEKLTRLVTIGLAILQGWSITYAFNKQYGIMSDTSTWSYIFTIVILMTGTMIITWLGDQITLHGIGNGISMLIFAGIAAELPNIFVGNFANDVLANMDSDLTRGIIHYAGFVLFYLLLVLLIVIFENGQKKIHMMTSAGKLSNGSNSTYMPIKVNPAGVMPIIFAQSIMTAPLMIISYFKYDTYENLSNIFSFSSPIGLTVYGVLTFLLTFFYVSIIMDPEEITDNYGKNGFYIPGVRPGKDTQRYLSITISRTILVGAIGITVMAILPYLLSIFATTTNVTALGGTGIIVAVGVILEARESVKMTVIENKYNRGWLLKK